MSDLSLLLTIATVHLIGLVSPGPDVALVVQNVSRYGRSTGILIALGLSIGILSHSLLSVTGVSLIVQQHPLLFFILQISGGSYLCYLGFGALRATISHWNREKPSSLFADTPELTIRSPYDAFIRGLMTNLLNPKALVFFVSLMSSLIPVQTAWSTKSAALLILWGLSFAWFSLLAFVLSTKRMQNQLARIVRYIDGVCGVFFSLLGCGIVLRALLSISQM